MARRTTLTAAACSAAALAGCMVLEGPCQLERQAEANSARLTVQCEAGGTASILAPGSVLEAAGRAAAQTGAANGSE